MHYCLYMILHIASYKYSGGSVHDIVKQNNRKDD